MDSHSQFSLLLSNDLIIQSLINGSASTGTYDDWKANRLFIASVIDSNGTILDIGCANGFLLRCLQEWSNYELIPYGIDRQEKLIHDAQSLFPSYKNHFIHLNVHHIHMLTSYDMPSTFDYIFWNFSTIWKITDDNWRNTFEKVLHMARKRLILGFYGRNCYSPRTGPLFDSPDWLADKRTVQDTLESFATVNIVFTGKMWNSNGRNHCIAWIDKNY